MEAGIKKFWIKFKNEILALIFLGILMIVIAAYIQDDYIRSILINLGTSLVMFPLFIILLFYALNQMRR